MCDKTPNKGSSHVGFTPTKLRESPAAGSPRKNLTGTPRVVRDLVADLYNNIQRWNDSIIKGAGIVKEICSIKSDDPSDFSEKVEDLCRDLYNIAQALKRFKNGLELCSSQVVATAKLHKEQAPIFISLRVEKIANLVNLITEAYVAEFKVKQFVLENVAYSKNKDEAMFVAALWTYNLKITEDIDIKLETLLIETGHRKI